MKKASIFTLFLLCYSTSVVLAQFKVVEESGKKPDWTMSMERGSIIGIGNGLTIEDASLLAARPDALRLWNKADARAALPAPEGWLAVSALNGDGIPKLLEALGTRLAGLVGRCRGAPSAHDEFIISNPRQRDLLMRATAALGAALVLIDATVPGHQGDDSTSTDEAGCSGQWLDAVAVDVRDAADAIGELTGEISSPEVLDAIFSGFCLGK